MKRRGIVGCIFLLTLIVLLVACGQKTPTWQEQYDLGVRYLSEGNYDEAIIAFTSAIEIDPKNADAYIGLADVYIRAEEYDKALDILNQGLEVLDDDADILQKISEVNALKIKLAVDNGDYSAFFDGGTISLDDWTVAGKPILDCGFEDFWEAYPDYNPSRRDSRYFSYDSHWPMVLVDGDASNHNFIVHFDVGNGGIVHDMRFDNISRVNAPLFQPELKGIQMNESFTAVLEKLGFSAVGINYLQDENNDFDIDLRSSNGPFIYFSREYKALHFQYSNPLPQKNHAEIELRFDDLWNLSELSYEVY